MQKGGAQGQGSDHFLEKVPRFLPTYAPCLNIFGVGSEARKECVVFLNLHDCQKIDGCGILASVTRDETLATYLSRHMLNVEGVLTGKAKVMKLANECFFRLLFQRK